MDNSDSFSPIVDDYDYLLDEPSAVKYLDVWCDEGTCGEPIDFLTAIFQAEKDKKRIKEALDIPIFNTAYISIHIAAVLSSFYPFANIKIFHGEKYSYIRVYKERKVKKAIPKDLNFKGRQKSLRRIFFSSTISEPNPNIKKLGTSFRGKKIKPFHVTGLFDVKVFSCSVYSLYR